MRSEERSALHHRTCVSSAIEPAIFLPGALRLARSSTFLAAAWLAALVGCKASSPQPPASEAPVGAASPAAPAGAAAPTARPAAVENTGADCPVGTLPTYDELPVLESLPDPFLSLDHSRITRRDQWRCRRAEIGALVQEYELGPKPPKPSQLSGSVANDVLSVTAGDGARSITFDATIQYPKTGTAPYPAMIALGRFSLDSALFEKLGVAVISFPNSELGQQTNGESRGLGKFYDLYGKDHPAGAMMAWAWGVSRLIDVLGTTPSANIDATRLGVTGCSRNGKGALVVGAFDERIALTIPQEAGAGGTSLWRVADTHHAAWLAAGSPPNQDVQTLGQITGENVWFTPGFKRFNQSATKLPFDHHMVMGLVAPRALFVVGNTGMYWLDREGSFAAASVAHSIWEALGVPDAMGGSQVGGHDHCRDVPAVQLAELGAYIQKFLVGGGTADTNVLYTDGGFTVDRARWVGWETPKLEPAAASAGG